MNPLYKLATYVTLLTTLAACTPRSVGSDQDAGQDAGIDAIVDARPLNDSSLQPDATIEPDASCEGTTQVFPCNMPPDIDFMPFATDSLEEGATQSYQSTDGTSYVITPFIISNWGGMIRAKFDVGDEVSRELEPCDTETFSDGVALKIESITINPVECGSDSVRFRLGYWGNNSHKTNQ